MFGGHPPAGAGLAFAVGVLLHGQLADDYEADTFGGAGSERFGWCPPDGDLVEAGEDVDPLPLWGAGAVIDRDTSINAPSCWLCSTSCSATLRSPAKSRTTSHARARRHIHCKAHRSAFDGLRPAHLAPGRSLRTIPFRSAPHPKHQAMRAYKVGITNVGTNRLAAFQLRGWQVLNLELFTVGTHAAVVERAIKRWWRADIGLSAYLGPEDLPQTGGWSETISVDGSTAIECIERIRRETTVARGCVTSVRQPIPFPASTT